MVSIEHIILSLIVNAVGICCVALLKSAPPRVVLFVCLGSMSSIFFPWTVLGGWIGPFMPMESLTAVDGASTAAFENIEKSNFPSNNTWILLSIGWLAIGVSWIIKTLRQSLLITREWRKIASDAGSLAEYAHSNLFNSLNLVRIKRLPNSSIVATTGLFKPEIWIGDRVNSEAQVRTALNHELSHLASKDQYTLFLIVLIERFLWWNPLTWILGRYARRSMEHACDFRTASLVGTNEYRMALAELFLVNRAPSTALEISLGSQSEIVNRMEKLEMSQKLKLRHLLTLGCASFLTMGAVGVGFASQEPPASTRTLIECHDLLPEGVQYDFSISSAIDTRAGKKGVLSVTLLDATKPELRDVPPEGSERFLQCVQRVVGVGDDEGWPGT